MHITHHRTELQKIEQDIALLVVSQDTKQREMAMLLQREYFDEAARIGARAMPDTYYQQMIADYNSWIESIKRGE